MDINKLNILLTAYYEGETSREQEKDLFYYFSQENIPEELADEKKTFLKLYSLSENSDINIPDGFDKKIDQLIDNLDKKEKNKARLIKLWKKIGGVAASIIVVFSIGTFVYQDNTQPLMVDTYNNPEEAYIKTEKTLLLMSHKLNKGFDQLEKAEKDVLKVNQILNEKLN